MHIYLMKFDFYVPFFWLKSHVCFSDHVLSIVYVGLSVLHKCFFSRMALKISTKIGTRPHQIIGLEFCDKDSVRKLIESISTKFDKSLVTENKVKMKGYVLFKGEIIARQGKNFMFYINLLQNQLQTNSLLILFYFMNKASPSLTDMMIND